MNGSKTGRKVQSKLTVFMEVRNFQPRMETGRKIKRDLDEDDWPSGRWGRTVSIFQILFQIMGFGTFVQSLTTNLENDR